MMAIRVLLIIVIGFNQFVFSETFDTRKLIDEHYLPQFSNLNQMEATSYELNAFDLRNFIAYFFEPKFSEAQNVQVASDIWSWLKIFNQKHVFESQFPAASAFGEVYGAYVAAQGLTADIETLKGRQMLVRSAKQSKSETLAFHQKLAEIKGQEAHLVEVYDNLSPLNSKKLFGFFPANEALPSQLVEYVPESMQGSANMQKVVDKEVLKAYRENTNPAAITSDLLQPITMIVPLTVGEFFTSRWFMAQYDDIRIKGLIGLWRAFTYGSIISATKQRYAEIQHTNEDLTGRLRKAASVVRVLLDAASLSGKFPEESLRISLDDNVRLTMQAFVLRVARLDLKNSYSFVNLGKAMAALRELIDLRESLVELFSDIGRVDFYTSISVTMLAETTEYNFVAFEKANPTHLAVQGLRKRSLEWVENDIELGGEGARNMVLTGQPRSGKSELMRNLGQTVFMAQTIGLCLGKMTLTPFNAFNALMDVFDKPGELSSYESEEVDIKMLMRIYRNFSNDIKALLFLDKPFSSTDVDKGNYVLKEKSLPLFLRLKNAITLVSTNLAALESMSENADFSTKNMLMEEYRLMPGFDVTSHLAESLKLKLEKLGYKP